MPLPYNMCHVNIFCLYSVYNKIMSSREMNMYVGYTCVGGKRQGQGSLTAPSHLIRDYTLCFPMLDSLCAHHYMMKLTA